VRFERKESIVSDSENISGKCIFCEIAGGRAPAHIVLENELSMALLDINPLSRGHCLVIPKRHVQWWHEMTEEETASVYDAARRVALKLMETFKPDFICQYARGRRIPHTHIFLVPSFAGDVLDRFFNTLEIVQEKPQDLVALKKPASLADTARLLRDI
jgi:histidine triad (HIT) family protein